MVMPKTFGAFVGMPRSRRIGGDNQWELKCVRLKGFSSIKDEDFSEFEFEDLSETETHMRTLENLVDQGLEVDWVLEEYKCTSVFRGAPPKYRSTSTTIGHCYPFHCHPI